MFHRFPLCYSSILSFSFYVDASTEKDDVNKEEGSNLSMGLSTRSRGKQLKTAFQSFVGQFIEERLGGLDIKSGPNRKIIEEMKPIQLIHACGLDLEF